MWTDFNLSLHLVKRRFKLFRNFWIAEFRCKRNCNDSFGDVFKMCWRMVLPKNIYKRRWVPKFNGNFIWIFISKFITQLLFLKNINLTFNWITDYLCSCHASISPFHYGDSDVGDIVMFSACWWHANRSPT